MPKELRFKSHPVFDIEARWGARMPCPVDLAPFQRRMDAVTGKTPDGRPRVRVVWGADPAQRQFICGQWVLRYWHFRNEVRRERFNPATGLWEAWTEIEEIPTPRFYVQELHENRELHARDAWERARWSWIDGQRVDVLGPVPEEGFYTDLFMIAHHDRLCCRGSEVVRGLPCLGAYREPGEADLDRLRRIVRAKERAAADEVAPSAETVERRRLNAAREQEERFRGELGERMDDFLRTHVHRLLTDDPSIENWGKYHFVGENAGHSKSGLKPKGTNGNSSSDN